MPSPARDGEAKGSSTPAVAESGGCCQARKTLQPRHASLFWIEKLLLLLQCLQAWGLLWAFSRSWPLPSTLRQRTRWLTWLNLDIPSFFSYIDDETIIPEHRGTAFGTFSYYWAIALGFAYSPLFVLLGVRAFEWLQWRRYRLTSRLVLLNRQVLLMLGMAFHLPITLNTLRIYACEDHPLYPADANPRLAVDPELQCYTLPHFLILGFAAPMALAVVVGFPVKLALLAHNLSPLHRPFQHERFLRWKEAEYDLAINSDWFQESYWLISSFSRRKLHPYSHALWAGTMSALCLIFTFLRSQTGMQADIFFACMVLWSLRQFLSPGYRILSSNLLAFAFYTGTAVALFWGLMRAHGLVNSFTVDSAFTDAIVYIGGATVGSGFLICLPALCYSSRARWPKGYIGPELWRTFAAGSGVQLVPLQLPEEAASAVALEAGRHGSSRSGSSAADGSVAAAGVAVKVEEGSAEQASAAGSNRMLLGGSSTSTALGAHSSSAAAADAAGTALQEGSSEAPAVSSALLQRARPSQQEETSGSSSSKGKVDAAGSSRSQRVSSLLPSARLRDRQAGAVTEVVASAAAAAQEAALASALASEEKVEQYLQEQAAMCGGCRCCCRSRRAQGKKKPTAGKTGTSATAFPSSSASTAAGERLQAGADVEAGASGDEEQEEEEDEEESDAGTLASDPQRGTSSVGGASSSNSRLPLLRAGATASAAAAGTGSPVAPGSTTDSQTEYSALLSPGTGSILAYQPVQAAAVSDSSASRGKSKRRRTGRSSVLTAVEVSALEEVWVLTLRSCKKLLQQSAESCSELVNVPLLRGYVRSLNREMQRARLMRHVLCWSLELAVEDCKATIRSTEGKSFYSHPLLRDIIPTLQDIAARRSHFYALCRPKRRRVIFLLYAMRCLMNGRNIDRAHIKGVNDALYKLRFNKSVFLGLEQAIARGEKLKEEDIPDEFTRYRHIQSPLQDASAFEVSMWSLGTLRSGIMEALLFRIEADVKAGNIRRRVRSEAVLEHQRGAALVRSAAVSSLRTSLGLDIKPQEKQKLLQNGQAGGDGSSPAPLHAGLPRISSERFQHLQLLFPSVSLSDIRFTLTGLEGDLTEDTADLLCACYDHYALHLRSKPNLRVASHLPLMLLAGKGAISKNDAVFLELLSCWMRLYVPGRCNGKDIPPLQQLQQQRIEVRGFYSSTGSGTGAGGGAENASSASRLQPNYEKAVVKLDLSKSGRLLEMAALEEEEEEDESGSMETVTASKSTTDMLQGLNTRSAPASSASSSAGAGAWAVSSGIGRKANILTGVTEEEEDFHFSVPAPASSLAHPASTSITPVSVSSPGISFSLPTLKLPESLMAAAAAAGGAGTGAGAGLMGDAPSNGGDSTPEMGGAASAFMLRAPIGEVSADLAEYGSGKNASGNDQFSALAGPFDFSQGAIATASPGPSSSKRGASAAALGGAAYVSPETPRASQANLRPFAAMGAAGAVDGASPPNAAAAAALFASHTGGGLSGRAAASLGASLAAAGDAPPAGRSTMRGALGKSSRKAVSFAAATEEEAAPAAAEVIIPVSSMSSGSEAAGSGSTRFLPGQL